VRVLSLARLGCGFALLAACGPGGFISGLGTSTDGHGDEESDDDTTVEGDTIIDDDTTGGETTGGETPGDGDGDDPTASACDAWQATEPIDPLPPDACLTQGTQPLSPDPPQGPFPADPGEVVCGSGWGHGLPTPSFDWSVELDTPSGGQFLSLTPDAEMLVISDSFQGFGGQVLRYDAETGEPIDVFDVSDVFERPDAIAALDHDRWIVVGMGEAGDYDDEGETVVVEMQLGMVAWKTVLSPQEIGAVNLGLTANGDILLASDNVSFLRVDRVRSDGELLWTWSNDVGTPTRPHVTEAPDGSIIVSAATHVLELDADGQLLQQLAPLSFRHMAATAVGDDLLLAGNGHADGEPNYTWLEAARWSRSNAEVEWSREHRRALSWNGSTNLYNTIHAVVPHPCGGFVIAGVLAVQSSTCNSQPWVAALDDAGEIIWADRIHRCGGRPALAVSPDGDVWLLTNFVTGTRPLLRRYSL
jgi:hypothetical protein